MRRPYRRLLVAAMAIAGTALPSFGGEASAQDEKAPPPGAAESKPVISIPHTSYQLSNGLTVILHEDHSQPLVVVNINVRAGSRDEEPNRTGFAHLFEHLMFMGTERVPEKMFDAWMEAQGGSNNAWTSNDNTNYYDIGPSHTLPLLLWMEADRLSVLGQQITQDKLDTQRDVVRNERRQQIENKPYAKARLVLPELLFPKGHPYHHPVIGSHEDLEAANVADVRGFFTRHYVPANTSLVVAGDFDPQQVRPLVERYFGSVPSGSPTARVTAADPQAQAKLTEVKRVTIEDNVTAPKVIMAWLSPAHFAPGDAELDLLAAVLSNGKASRLYKPLVYDKQIAQSVYAYQVSQSLQSYFAIEAIAQPGKTLDEVEQEIDAALEKVRTEAVTAEELARAKNGYEAGFVARLQSLATRASLLNSYFSEKGEPDYSARDLERYQKATAGDLLRYAKSTLDPNARVILRIVPKGQADGGEQ